MSKAIEVSRKLPRAQDENHTPGAQTRRRGRPFATSSATPKQHCRATAASARRWVATRAAGLDESESTARAPTVSDRAIAGVAGNSSDLRRAMGPPPRSSLRSTARTRTGLLEALPPMATGSRRDFDCLNTTSAATERSIGTPPGAGLSTDPLTKLGPTGSRRCPLATPDTSRE